MIKKEKKRKQKQIKIKVFIRGAFNTNLAKSLPRKFLLIKNGNESLDQSDAAIHKYEKLRYLDFGRSKYCKEKLQEHLETRGGCKITANLRLAYSFITSGWGEALGIRGCFAFLLVKKKNKREALKHHRLKFLRSKLWTLGFI